MPLSSAQRTGNALALAPDGSRLYLASEDDAALFTFSLPLLGAAPLRTPLPGPPAQVVATADRVLVSIRQPSLLLVLQPTDAGMEERARMALPADAWGLALAPNQNLALVTSAWSSQLSAVDVDRALVLWSHSLAREPRAVVWVGGEAGTPLRAYVSHLVGSELTRVDDVETNPVLTRVALPASPLRAPKPSPAGRPSSAALGYALVTDPEERHLFAARHALGAVGKNAWFGAATVDSLLLPSDVAAAPLRPLEPIMTRSTLAEQLISGGDTQVPGSSLTPFVQPRALVYRRRTQTLLVLGEGNDRIAELDALALDPTMAVVHVYALGRDYHQDFHVPRSGAAPTGLVLSADEQRAYVYCRATRDVLEVQLADPSAAQRLDANITARVELGPDPLGPFGATGRKLFYAATDRNVSGGLGCAACHPDGRDDGFTWHEATFVTEDGQTTNFVGSPDNIPPEAHTLGFARRTPYLAGRVNGDGPYGWHAESPSLEDREIKGFGLHRWGSAPEHAPEASTTAAAALSDFLRRGLVAPEAKAQLSALEREGRTLFNSPQTQCSECHPAGAGYTLGHVSTLGARPTPPSFDVEPNGAYKVPSLRHLAGRAPYFHDGSAPDLETLVRDNQDRMGRTSTLSTDQQHALVAFLKTL